VSNHNPDSSEDQDGATNPPSADSDEFYFDNLLDDLYSLQKNLFHSEPGKAQETELPEINNDEDFDSLEIPILTQSLNQEIDSEHQSRKAFNEAQHHLFEKPELDQDQYGQAQLDNEQVNAIVNKLMNKLKPKVEQLLREKIRAKVIERFNQQN
jgi:UDP-N-acetylenolpyruvoylglucosamine reductase